MNSINNLTGTPDILATPGNPNILVSYSGHVDSQVLSTLFTQTEACLDLLNLPSALKAKILGIMIEMLQNIVDHSSSDGVDNNLKISSFTLEKSRKGFILRTINKIYSRMIPHLKKRIEYLNSLTPADMTTLYRDILKNGNPASETSGLGLIDIIRKSGNPVSFMFSPSGNKYSVFTVKAVV